MPHRDKRIHPPIWQHDYHVLRLLYQSIKTANTNIKTGNLVVDYGCGDLPYKHLFTKFKKYLGLDIDKNKHADILIKVNQKLPLKDKCADLILSTQVLEHVQNPEFYMKECERLVKSGGYLLLSTHGVWPYNEYPFDYHRWTKTGLSSLLANHGFKIIEITPILTGFAMTLQFEMLLFAQIFQKWGVWGKPFYILISLTGNLLIHLLNLMFYDKQAYDASVFVILAQRK